MWGVEVELTPSRDLALMGLLLWEEQISDSERMAQPLSPLREALVHSAIRSLLKEID
jgi:hypothetical protein